MTQKQTDWEKEERINKKIDFVVGILDAILDAAKETPGASLYSQVRHAVQHMEGYPSGFNETLTDSARERLIKIVEKFYQLYEDKDDPKNRN